MYESIIYGIYMYAQDMHITTGGRKLKANHPTILIILSLYLISETNETN